MTEQLKQAERALDRMSGYMPRIYKDDIEIVRRALTTSQPAQAGEVDERVAFEKWRASFGWKRPFDPGELEAFRAGRASLPTQPAAQATPPQQAAGEPVGEPAVTITFGDTGMVRNLIIHNESIKGQRLDLFTHPAPGVPEGFALVPVKATPKVAMVIYEGARNCFSPKVAEGLWQDALAAAQAKGGEHA